MDDDQIDPVEMDVEEEEELDEDGLPKKIPGLEDDGIADEDEAI